MVPGRNADFFKFLVIYLFLAVLVLHCYADFSLVVVSGATLVVVSVLLIAATSLVAEHGL